MRPSRNNPGESHENGCFESRHAQDGATTSLLLLCSNDFSDRSPYEAFIEIAVQRMNARVEKRLVVERVARRPLPAHRALASHDALLETAS
jgi:hypothetical protein